MNWKDKLIHKQWKLGILEQGVNSPDENKLYLTKNWQIENEHFVILVLEVFKSWKNWTEIRNFDSKDFRQESWSKIILKMSTLYAVDNYVTFPVNRRYFFFLVNQEDCQAATKNCSQIYGIRMVHRETFLGWSTCEYFDILFRNAQLKGSVTGNIPVQASTETPATESGDRDHTNLEPIRLKSKTVSQFSVLIFDSWRDHRLQF